MLLQLRYPSVHDDTVSLTTNVGTPVISNQHSESVGRRGDCIWSQLLLAVGVLANFSIRKQDHVDDSLSEYLMVADLCRSCIDGRLSLDRKACSGEVMLSLLSLAERVLTVLPAAAASC